MNKPLLGPCDTYQLEPFEYPWAWEMSLECESNTWSPEEIAVADDVRQWKGGELNAKEQHLFLAIMAQLTTFDIQRGDDAGEILLGVLQPAEIRHFLKRLIWEEALHTRSYRYIIDNFDLDLEIYKRWETVPALYNRIEYGQDLSERMDAPSDILLALIFWFQIFEGTWFTMSLLGPIQSLSRRGLMRGAAEQFQYIMRDEFQHIRFGTALTNEFIRQYPEAWNNTTKNRIRAMFIECLELEEEYMKYCLPEPILGYRAEDHILTARHYADRRLNAIGIESLYHAPNAMPWMNEMALTRKEKNFFESRVTEYQTGGALKWD